MHFDLDKRTRSAEDLLQNNENVLQTKHPRDTTMDTSINNVEKTVVQPHNIHIHTQIYTYFVTTWKKVLTVLKEISENWKSVREYILIGTIGILISIFCVLNLIYK